MEKSQQQSDLVQQTTFLAVGARKSTVSEFQRQKSNKSGNRPNEAASDLGIANANDLMTVQESVHSQAKSGSQTSKIIEFANEQKEKDPTMELHKGPTMFARVREVATLREQAQNEFDPTSFTYDDLIVKPQKSDTNTRSTKFNSLGSRAQLRQGLTSAQAEAISLRKTT